MRRDDIEQRAEQTLAAHGVRQMPVNPVRLAEEAHIAVYNAQFRKGDVAGMIHRENGDTAIYVNVNDRPTRKRFTVAHELGHYVLHLQTADGAFVDEGQILPRIPQDPDAEWTDYRVKEWEANVFAAALLMPASEVRRIWESVGNVEGLARYFQVSHAAMAIRLSELGIEA